MLGLQVVPPGDRELELLRPICSRMSTASVYGSRTNSLATIASSVAITVLSMRVVEEFHVLGALFQHVAEDALQEPLGQVHVVGQLEEGHLRLDHPELGQVARGVRVLGAERRAERVDLAQRAGEDLGLQLAADGQIRGPVEKVLRVVDLPDSALGTVARSSVVTLNISPAPSQSLAVMIGVWT